MNFEALAHLVRPLPAPATSDADPLAAAARILLADHADALPDLTGLIVLLPSLHTVAPFARALARAAGRPALLLPQLTTLPQLAATVALPQPIVADSARQSLVYAALREKDWLREGDRWAVAGELVGLFDELTLHQVALPAEPGEFAARLAEAYGSRSAQPLQFEARLVHELWFAMHGILGDRADRARAYQLRLGQLAAQAARPLYAIGLAELAPSEIEFFLRYAERQRVALLQPAPLAADGDAMSQVLATSWRASDIGLPQRAAQLRERLPHSPLGARLRLFPAHSLEQEARAAETQIRRWLAQGRRSIAVVAQDRLAARRVRALLERAQVLVEDETGWTLSTAAASSVVMRWLDLLAGDFFHQDLLDFLKSPLVFADWAPAERKEAVYELEQLIREKSIVSGLIHYRTAAHAQGARCAALLERLHEARRLWPRRALGLRAWLDILQRTLDGLGITGALQSDLAGAQLLATLAALGEELGEETAQFQLGEWRQWLDHQLETATFRDTGIVSPVVFTHLPATRLRRFDGVVLLGCDAEKLPSRGSDGLFFNQSVRAQLGLPLREARTRIELEDVAALLAGCGDILVTWQRMADGEEQLISPWFDLLQTLHQLAYQDDLLDTELAALASVAGIAPETAFPVPATAQPAPALPPPRVPDTISASGYNSLLACPYQYYARHVLKLNDVDEVQVEMEKRDFGELVHRILLEFHRTHPVFDGTDDAALARSLRDISQRVFEPMLRLNYLSHAWALRWDALVPEYIAWQREREQAGWRWHSGETARRIALPLPNGGSLNLRGTLDRVDRAGDRLAVLDYKTRSVTALRTQLKVPGEDVQLPVYALLAEGAVSEACYVSLDKDEVRAVPLQAELDALARDVAGRLADIFAALHAGAALPAQGTDETCGWCEMRGLCRRDYWRKTS